MYTNILIPTDGSRLSESAATDAIKLAKAVGARVTVLHVTPRLREAPLDSWAVGDTRSRSRLRALVRRQAQAYLAAVEHKAKEAGVQCSCVAVSGVAPYEAMLRTAARKGCDLIYMSAHGRAGPAGLVLGSETMKVLVHSGMPVLVHRANGGASASGVRAARAHKRIPAVGGR